MVEEGNFTVYDGENEMARVGPGSCFGELALLHGGPRAASVKCALQHLFENHQHSGEINVFVFRV